MGIEVTEHGAWQVATIPSSRGGGFIGWAKQGAIEGTSPLDEPGDPVFFEFGRDRASIVASLLREVGLLH